MNDNNTALAVIESPSLQAIQQDAYNALTTSSDIPWLSEEASRASKIIGAMRVMEATQEQIIAAIRYQALAVRQLALLGAIDQVKTHKTIARRLAEIPEHEVEDFLNRVPHATSLTRFYEILRSEEASERNDRAVDAWDMDEQELKPPIFAARLTGYDLEGFVRRALLAGETSGSISIGRATDDILAELELRCNEDDIVRRGIRAALTYALSDHNCPNQDSRPRPEGVPEYITTRLTSPDGDSDDEEWVRKHWTIARVEDLLWMAEYRTTQAEQLARKAVELQTVADRLADKNPRTMLTQIFQKAGRLARS